MIMRIVICDKLLIFIIADYLYQVIGELQLDSYSETAASPVLLYVVRTPITTSTQTNSGPSSARSENYPIASSSPLGTEISGSQSDQVPDKIALEPALKFSLFQEYNPLSGTFHYR